MNTASFAVTDLEGALVRDASQGFPDLFPAALLGPHLKRDLLEEIALESPEELLGRLDLLVAQLVAGDGSDVGGQGCERRVEGVGHELSVGLSQQSLKRRLEMASWVDAPASRLYGPTHRLLKVCLENALVAHSYRTQSADGHNKTNGPGACDSYIAHAPALTTRLL